MVKIEHFKKYKCKINLREEFEGNLLKPKVKQLQGVTLILQALWVCGTDEKYHGEWAMGYRDEEDSEKLLKDACILWIASGDLEILEVHGE